MAVFIPALHALDPDKSVFQFNCENWTRLKGLPAEKISSVSQTRDGYIWLGTQNGLVRFDGLEFKTVPIDLPQAQGQEVRKLVQASDGGLWFAVQDGGYGHYDGRSFSPVGDERWALPGVNATAILEAHDGTIWTGAQLDLGHWMNGKPGESTIDDTTIGGAVLSFAQDASGRIWMGTSEHGLFYLADGKLVEFRDDYLKKRNLFALAFDRDGSLWVGTEFGLRCYDAHGRLREIPPLTPQIEALLVDRHGILWVGTSGMGLARFANGAFSYLRKADGLGSDYVRSLFEDAEGSLWVGTAEGLSQLTDLKFPIYSGKEGLLDCSTHAVAVSRKGGLWIASSLGLSYFDGRTAQNYTDGLALNNRYIKCVLEAANGDIYMVDGDKNIVVFSGGAVAKVFQSQVWSDALAEDAKGILVGVGPELFRIRDGQLQRYPFKNSLQPVFYWINNLLVARDGAIWLACNNGIFRVQDGSWEQWSTANGLISNRIHTIIEDEDGNIWAGSIAGIVRIKEHRLATIRMGQGLYDDRIYGLVPDDRGSFWISSGRGIFRVTRQSLNDCADGRTAQVKCEVFDGLESVKFTDRTDQGYSGCRTADGRIWFPNPHGVVMIDPGRYFVNKTPPQVHLSEVRINGAAIEGGRSAIQPAGNGRVEFYFTALSYISPEKVRVQYQLEGFDPTWMEAGAHRSVLYNNLNPGPYRFRVQACNADGVWNTAGDGIDLDLPPRYYQTAWFYSVCSMAGLLALFGIYRWKVRQLRAHHQRLQGQNDLLEVKVAQRTDELEHSLSLLKATLDSTADGILAFQFSDQAVSFNRQFAEMWKLPPELAGKASAIGLRAFTRTLVNDPEHFDAGIKRFIGDPKGEAFGVIELKDGRIFEYYCKPQSAAGKNIGVVINFRDITGRRLAEAEREDMNRQLIEASRQAGMAEVATGVLHNVGNVLNSINVSTTLVADHVHHTRAVNISKIAALFDEHKADLAGFLTNDSRGQMVPSYLSALAETLATEQKALNTELGHLQKNVEHIKEIVATQQSYARTSGATETVSVPEMIESALLINAGSLARHEVEIIRDYQASPAVDTNKHKVMQILINLVSNAKYACDESGRTEKRITVRTTSDDRGVKIAVIDNGAGIPAENLTRIFNHGFTTREHGHGFGLHSSALAARELGGSVTVQSDGPGHGATFILELPYKPETSANENSVC
jgi:ligand-binding sensor domain-containing protein/C4-dicarboxylate-specific signal transduction histidine kinase